MLQARRKASASFPAAARLSRTLSNSRTAAMLCLLAFTFLPNSVMAAVAGQESAHSSEPAAVTLPATPAGNQFAEWLRVFNLGDAKQTTSFITKHFEDEALKRVSAEERANMETLLYRSTHALVPYRVDWSTDPEIAVVTRSNLTGESVRIHVEVGSDPLHHITKFNYTLTGRPADTRSLDHLSPSQILQHLEAYLDRLSAADLFSGSVLVARDGKPIFEKACGMVDPTAKTANRLDTKFNLASMNKMFTGVAIAQLATQGKLSFNGTIGKYLPDYPNKVAAEQVTIDQLLTHTSGMGDYFNQRFEREKGDLRSVKDYLSLFANDRLPYKVGEKYRYSNAGYVVLGAIVEKVSGQDYFDYVREHVYKLADMNNTDDYELDRQTPNRATGYTSIASNGRPELLSRVDNLNLLPVKGSPAGGGFSTVEDLLKFADALRSNKLLDAKSTELVLAGKIDRDDEQGGRYGYGFAEDTVNGKRVVGYAGAFPGVDGVFDIYPDLGYTVVVLSNYDPPSAQRVAYQLREMITQQAAH